MGKRGRKQLSDNSVSEEDSSVFLQEPKYGYDELMKKLCTIESAIGKINETVEELRSTLLLLRNENDNLKAEVSELRGREEELQTQLAETRAMAELADRRSEDVEIYSRRNNLRVFGVGEKSNQDGQEESAAQCEAKVLSLFRDQLRVPIDPKELEAVHRVGKRGAPATHSVEKPRPIIIRFLSCKTRDRILYSRRKLRGTKQLIVEDLTPLLCKTKDCSVCERAWTKNGKVWMVTKTGRITKIDTLADLGRVVRESGGSGVRST